jgi:hypothetical protein
MNFLAAYSNNFGLRTQAASKKKLIHLITGQSTKSSDVVCCAHLSSTEARSYIDAVLGYSLRDFRTDSSAELGTSV